MSPSFFSDAADHLADAERRHDAGGSTESVRGRLSDAQEDLASAERQLATGRPIFEEALMARNAALEVDAPDRAPDLWRRAEREMLETGRQLEGGDVPGVRVRIDGVERMYIEAELEAFRSDILARAQEARAAAVDAGATQLAPLTFGQGDSLVTLANRVLEGERAARAEASTLGEQATDAYLRSRRIAVVADSVLRRRIAFESVVLGVESELADVAEQLGFRPDFAYGAEPVFAQSAAAIASLQTDRANLQTELARSEAESRDMQAALDSLDALLAVAESREAEVSAQLRGRQRREARIRELSAILSEEEGEVLIQTNRIVLRLTGLTFASGSTEIRPEHYAILTKVQRVVRDFPDAPVTIEGHTDSQGNDDFNRTLSQRRALAVQEYLLLNLPVSADRFRSVGYGEDRPIASNQTAAGREQNRRIDIVLDLPVL